MHQLVDAVLENNKAVRKDNARLHDKIESLLAELRARDQPSCWGRGRKSSGAVMPSER